MQAAIITLHVFAATLLLPNSVSSRQKPFSPYDTGRYIFHHGGGARSHLQWTPRRAQAAQFLAEVEENSRLQNIPQYSSKGHCFVEGQPCMGQGHSPSCCAGLTCKSTQGSWCSFLSKCKCQSKYGVLLDKGETWYRK